MAILNDPSADVTFVASAAADADAAVAANAGLRLLGYSVKESAGAPAAAELNIVHGATGAAGTNIGAHHDLAANGEKERWFGRDGIKVPNGISIDRIAGSTEVTLYTRTVI